ncbi:MAG: hypothetical protein F6K21_15275 [Symploca sp. SIO2D2]|nr:hypothetical protein [Symploca sp. SIO2D2]
MNNSTTKKVLTSILTTFATAFAVVTGFTVATAQPSPAEGVSFSCDYNGIHPDTQLPTPVTVARGPIGNTPVVYWVRSLGGYSPEQRCNIVSSQFDSLQQKGALEYISHGYMGGQSVICTANYNGGDCVEQLFTLHPQDKPQEVLEQLLGVRDLASKAAFMGGAVQRVGDTFYVSMPLWLDYQIGESQK